MNFENLFPDEREKGETLTRQCQLVMLRMLKIVDFLCNKHDIKYFLTGGTMLGAVRHKGFIPWDDDLDIGMTRANYEKFVQYAVPELPEDIFFQNSETDAEYPPAHLMEAKIRDKYSRYSGALRRWHNGLMIDISVYDRAYLPHNFFIFALNRLFIRNTKPKDKKIPDKRRIKVLKWIEKHSPIPLVYSTSFICKLKMLKLGTNYIRAKEISSLVETRFEDMQTFIPVGWNAYLKRRYGNYIKLPPAYRQRGHHSNSNYMQFFMDKSGNELDSIYTPDPFTPCNHDQILFWKERKPHTCL